MNLALPPAGGRCAPRRAASWRRTACKAALLSAAAASAAAMAAEIELTAPDGRRVVLKDDGTWQYRQEPSAAEGTADAKPESPPAELRLVSRTDRGSGCRFVLSLDNILPHEIRSVVPTFAAQRADGVVLETQSAAFQSLRPGARQERTLDFRAVACSEIRRVQVGGGDRCEIGELNKFADAKGQCLARIRVVESPLLRFDK